jgi:chemotaxis protein methyltransferase CheR
MHAASAPASTAATSAPSANAVAVLTALLEARTGQQIASYRAWRLDTALMPVLRDRGLACLDQLVTRILDGSDPTLGDRVVDALLNGETSFFRDGPVFDQIADAALAAGADGRRVRIWSAGCSTGQEPLSLAMLLAERDGAAVPEIVATDVSEGALARARAGRYSQFEIQRGLPMRRMIRWFEAEGEGDWIARPELLRHVAYRRMNLVADRAPAGLFDLVLCRNVLLYLSPELKARVFERFAAALRPGGVLVLGAGETVIGQTRQFEPSTRHRGFYTRS